MKHYIIIKFNDGVINKEKITKEIRELFHESLNIEGIHQVFIFDSSIELPNRYDLMILIELDKVALQLFDDSVIHKYWKKYYSSYIQSKIIFDCE